MACRMSSVLGFDSTGGSCVRFANWDFNVPFCLFFEDSCCAGPSSKGGSYFTRDSLGRPSGIAISQAEIRRVRLEPLQKQQPAVLLLPRRVAQCFLKGR